MGRSKIKIPAGKTGTARNMNTVAKLVEIASKSRVQILSEKNYHLSELNI
jgi:hypothetical protein